jgi:hypothetical protein
LLRKIKREEFNGCAFVTAENKRFIRVHGSDADMPKAAVVCKEKLNGMARLPIAWVGLQSTGFGDCLTLDADVVEIRLSITMEDVESRFVLAGGSLRISLKTWVHGHLRNTLLNASIMMVIMNPKIANGPPVKNSAEIVEETAWLLSMVELRLWPDGLILQA